MSKRESPSGFVVFEVDGENRLFPLSSMSRGVGSSIVGAFPPKQVIGDYTRVHHEVLSSLVQQDWTGGGQIYDSQESTDTSRYSGIASLETRYPMSLSLLPKSNRLEGPNDVGAWCLGDFPINNEKWFMASFGDTLYRVNGLNDPITISGAWKIVNGVSAGGIDETFVPVAEGAVYGTQGAAKMFIPGGSRGYAVFDGVAVTGYSAQKPLNFAVHDRKLWMLTTAGELLYSLNGTTWTSVVSVPAGYTPRGVAIFFDRNESPTPHIVTDSVVFSVDAAAPALYETELNYPAHPYAGTAWDRYRTDLYVSIGLGLQRYTLGTVNAAGIDRDDGPGSAYVGNVKSVERGFNDLFCLIEGALSDVGEELWTFQGQQDVYVDNRVSVSSLMRLTGMGSWHTLWTSPASGGSPTNCFVSGADGLYRIYWCWNGDLWWSDLPFNFENPRQNLTAKYAESGRLESSWFDMQMVGMRMTLATMEVRVKKATPTEKVRVLYQIDDDDEPGNAGWRILGEITTPGLTMFRIGLDGSYPDGTERVRGVGFSRVRYALEMERRLTKDDPNDAGEPDPDSLTPIVESVAMAFIKRMGRLYSFRFRVDCSSPEFDAGWGYGNRERRETLERLMESERFIPFAYNDRWYSVKVAGVSGQDMSGMDLRGDRDVTVIMALEL